MGKLCGWVVRSVAFPPKLLLENAHDLRLQLVGQANGGGGPLGILLDLAEVLVAGTASTGVVVLVIGAGSDGGFGDDLLVGAGGGRLANIADVSATFSMHMRR